MSPLRKACDEYLALRRAMGFKLDRPGRMLPDLVAHMERAGQATITTRAALEWAMRPTGHPQECAARLSVARGFARHLRALDGISEVPPTDLLPSCRRRLAPHLYRRICIPTRTSRRCWRRPRRSIPRSAPRPTGR